MDSLFVIALTSLVVHIPVYIVWLVGIVLAIVKWKKMPKVSLLTLIALVILFLLSVIGTVFSTIFPIVSDNYGLKRSDLGLIFTVVNIITSLINTGCWVLILAAIFGKRRETA